MSWFMSFLIKFKKLLASAKILQNEWKQRIFDGILLRLCNAAYKHNTTEKWTKGCILLFVKKDDLEISKNYSGISLTAVTAKVYDALFQNRIKPETENILKRNRKRFLEKSILNGTNPDCQTVERVQAKNFEAKLFLVFSKVFDSIPIRNMEQIILVYVFP